MSQISSSDEGDWCVAETGLPGRAECVNPAREVAVVSREAVGSGAGAGTALITASPGTPAEQAAQIVLYTPLRDASFCHTVGYLSPILVAMCITSACHEEAFPGRAVPAYLTSLDEIADATSDLGSTLCGADRVIAAGSLHDAPSARELSLEIAEGTRLSTPALGAQDTLHGYLAGHDEGSAPLVFATSASGGERSARTWRPPAPRSRRIGLRTALIVGEPPNGLIGADAVSAGGVVLPESDLRSSWAAVLGVALAPQCVAVELGAWVGKCAAGW